MSEGGAEGRMIIRARAPLRLSFCGGGTDLPPYPQERGGLVLSATIGRYAWATLRFLPERVLRIHSVDLHTGGQYGLGDRLELDGHLDLVKAAINRMLPGARREELPGLEVYLETEAPAGSGLGGSSALVAALLGALSEWRRVRHDKYEFARMAWEVEREDVGIPGGMQDQYAAVFGGFNLIEFYGPGQVVVNPLRVDPQVIDELQYNLLLVYVGRRRAGSVIEDQVRGYRERREGVREALDRIRDLTVAAKRALLRGRFQEFGEILHEAWLAKKRTAPTVSTPFVEEAYEEARKLGAIGGKISGAGGGGYMFLLCPWTRKQAIADRLRAMGGEVGGVVFEPGGLRAWRFREPLGLRQAEEAATEEAERPREAPVPV